MITSSDKRDRQRQERQEREKQQQQRMETSILAAVALRPGLNHESVAVILGLDPEDRSKRARVYKFCRALASAGKVRIVENPHYSKKQSKLLKLFPVEGKR